MFRNNFVAALAAGHSTGQMAQNMTVPPFEYVVSQPCLTSGNDKAHFAVPKGVGIWWFVQTEPFTGPADKSTHLANFLKKLQLYCKLYGMGNSRIRKIKCVCEDLKYIFKLAKKYNIKYLIIGASKHERYYHTAIKILEQHYGVATCHLNYESIYYEQQKDIQEDFASSLIKKANIKLGGLNYFVKDDSGRLVAADDLIIGVNVNYYDLPPYLLNELESDFGSTTTVVGYAANDLDEPNTFTGDYVYCLQHHEQVLERLKDIVRTCTERYRFNRDKCPQTIKVILSVRDCKRRFFIRYSEFRELCHFVKDTLSFTGSVEVISFNKLPDVFGEGEDKPIPGSVFDMHATSNDTIAFNMITHWAPIKNGKGKYEARAAHFEVYGSNRRKLWDVCQSRTQKKAQRNAGYKELYAMLEKSLTVNNSVVNSGTSFINDVCSQFPVDTNVACQSRSNDSTSSKLVVFDAKKPDLGLDDFVPSLVFSRSKRSRRLDQNANVASDRTSAREGSRSFSAGVSKAQQVDNPDIYNWPKLMHGLAHCHQQVSYPTSMPTPVHIARNLSRHGIMILENRITPSSLKGTTADVLEHFNKWVYKDTGLRDQYFCA